MDLTFTQSGSITRQSIYQKKYKNFISHTIYGRTKEPHKHFYQHPLPTALEIAKFEKRTKIKLPQDYHHFLLTINGGYPNKYYIPCVKNTIDHFYSFNPTRPSNSFNYLLLPFEKDHAQYLPIACSLSGDEYVMDMHNDEYSIFLRKYNEEDLLYFEKSQLVFVAENFSSLLDLLVCYEKSFTIEQ